MRAFSVVVAFHAGEFDFAVLANVAPLALLAPVLDLVVHAYPSAAARLAVELALAMRTFARRHGRRKQTVHGVVGAERLEGRLALDPVGDERVVRGVAVEVVEALPVLCERAERLDVHVHALHQGGEAGRVCVAAEVEQRALGGGVQQRGEALGRPEDAVGGDAGWGDAGVGGVVGDEPDEAGGVGRWS